MNLKSQFNIILLLIIFFGLFSCKKEAVQRDFIIPDEFTGAETEFNKLYDNWIWQYSNSQSSIGPSFAGNRTMGIWKDSVKFVENETVFFYYLVSTLEPDSLPYLHYFNQEREYEFSSSVKLFGSEDSLLLHTINTTSGAENDAIFKRD